MSKLGCLALVILILALLSTTCAPGNKANFNVNEPAGFWMGVWHGMISFFTLIISFFSDKIHMYEIHNKGSLYNAGFFIGLLFIYGGSSHTVVLSRKKDKNKSE